MPWLWLTPPGDPESVSNQGPADASSVSARPAPESTVSLIIYMTKRKQQQKTLVISCSETAEPETFQGKKNQNTDFRKD